MAYHRVRQQTTTPASGGSKSLYYKTGTSPIAGPYAGSTANTRYHRCDDWVETPPFTEQHGLSIIHHEVKPLVVDGDGPGDFHYKYSGYNPTSWTDHVYCPSAPSFDTGYWKAKALAVLNPFRPTVDLPVFLFELKDFPRMLKDLGRVKAGRVKPADVPGGYLSYVFGWAPLFSDLFKLLELAESIDRRMEDFQKAQNGSRVNRKLGSNEDTTWGTSGIDGFSFPYAEVTTLNVWASARIYLDDPVIRTDPYWEAAKATLGLNWSAAAIWEAMPWSWLVDYFLNIGDVLEARRGYSRWHFDRGCLMWKQSVTKYASGGTSAPGVSLSGGVLKTITKNRFVFGSDPNLTFAFRPWLSNGQYAILGALGLAAVLKAEHRR